MNPKLDSMSFFKFNEPMLRHKGCLVNIRLPTKYMLIRTKFTYVCKEIFLCHVVRSILKSNRSLELITIVLRMCEKGYCLSFPFLSFETIDKKNLMFIFVYCTTLEMIVNQKENIVKHRLPPLRFIFWPVQSFRHVDGT